MGGMGEEGICPFTVMFREVIDSFNPKKQLQVPPHPKGSRVVIVCLVGVVVIGGMLVGGLYGIFVLVSYFGSLQDASISLFFLGVLCFLVGWLLKRSGKVTREYALKWWNGEIPWWK